MIIYDSERKDLPINQLHKLFIDAGWSNGKEDNFKITHFNSPFINSTNVISAWDGEKLVGCVRVISDKIVRSIIQDLVVDKNYRGQGIGKELINKCIELYPKSEWLVCTTVENKTFYEKLNFVENKGLFLHIPSKWF